MTGYAQACWQIHPADDKVVVQHGTDDRRPVDRQGIPQHVQALCGQVVWRGSGVEFRASTDFTNSNQIGAPATCVLCARQAQAQDAVTADLVAAGEPLLWGGR